MASSPFESKRTTIYALTKGRITKGKAFSANPKYYSANPKRSDKSN